MSDYITLNKANWDERAPLHAASSDYETQALVDDPTHLSEVVRFDLPLLGDIAGARGVHLQCHIGTDTLSLARLGAQMTGLDFSPASIAQARLLAHRAGANLEFVEANVFEAAEALPLGALATTLTTDVNRSGLGHQPSTTGTRLASAQNSS